MVFVWRTIGDVDRVVVVVVVVVVVMVVGVVVVVMECPTSV